MDLNELYDFSLKFSEVAANHNLIAYANQLKSMTVNLKSIMSNLLLPVKLQRS
jgi:hypothetical protein